MCVLNQTSGTPLRAAKRLQFNVEIQPVDQLDEMKNLRKMVLPFFWVEEGVALNKTWTKLLDPLYM